MGLISLNSEVSEIDVRMLLNKVKAMFDDELKLVNQYLGFENMDNF